MRCGIVLVLTLLMASSAFGQDPMNPGDRVKIKTSDRGQTIVGTVQAILADRVDLVEGGSVSRSSIETIHRSQGMGTRVRLGMIIGGIAGSAFAGGFAATPVCACESTATGECHDLCGGGHPRAWALLIPGGAALGAVLGYQIKRERWKQVRLSVTTSPAVFGRGVSPTIDLTFTW